MKYFLFIIGVLIFSAPASSVTRLDDFSGLKGNEISGLATDSLKTYTLDSISKVDLGNKEMILDYGLNKIYVQDLVQHDHYYHYSLLEMSNAQAAFGIFSIERDNCSEQETPFKHYCMQGDTLRAVFGNYYLIINSDRKSRASSPDLLQISRSIMKKLNYSEIRLPELFEELPFSAYKNKIKYVRTDLSARYLPKRFHALAEGLGHFSMFYLPFEDGALEMDIMDIRFESIEGLQVFDKKVHIAPKFYGAELKSKDGAFYRVYQIARTRLLYLRYKSSNPKVLQLISIIEKIIR
jgi:hypothetical protein